jgi:HAD superfamily phosphatase (TIGR01668 family)
MRRRWHADMVAASLSAVDVPELLRAGIAAAIIDLDNTLVKYRSLHPAPEDVAWVKAATAAGLQIVLVTNNSTPWALTIAEDLQIPCIPNARKPHPRGFKKAMTLLGLPPERVIVIGDQYFTDVLGAKLSGLAVILVPPLGGRDPWNTRPLRLLARLLRVEEM